MREGSERTVMPTASAESPDVSIVLPVYFNQENLRRTFASLKQEVIDVHPELRFELVCVDDGSGDRSVEVLLELQREQPDLVRVITLTRNFGQVSALWCGYRLARGRYTVSMSADGQDPARLVNEILDGHIKEGFEVVICARQERDESAYRVLTSRVFYRLVQTLSFSNMPPGGFDLVSMSRRALDTFLQQPETHAFFQGQILWMGFPHKLIPYKREERQGGRSRWTFRKKLTYLIDGVLSYSYAPLRLMSLLGLGCALTGFGYRAADHRAPLDRPRAGDRLAHAADGRRARARRHADAHAGHRRRIPVAHARADAQPAAVCDRSRVRIAGDHGREAMRSSDPPTGQETPMRIAAISRFITPLEGAIHRTRQAELPRGSAARLLNRDRYIAGTSSDTNDDTRVMRNPAPVTLSLSSRRE